jgi:hypothetical protein
MASCFEIDAVEKQESPVRKLRWGSRIYLTKWPYDVRTAGPRLRLDRHFHVICMMRDPRNAVVSINAKYPDRYMGSLALWKREVRDAWRFIGHPRFIVVRYEEFVRDPDGVQAMLTRRMPFLRERAKFSQFHELSKPSASWERSLGGVRPITPDDIQAWRQHLPRLAGQIARHGEISDLLVATGYEQNDDWRCAIGPITADLGESRYERPRPRQSIRLIQAWIICVFVLAARAIGLRVS